MKTVMARIAKVLLFSVMVMFLVDEAGLVLRDKKEVTQLSTFKDQEENSIDVLILGSSHVYRFLQPMYLWEYYGIASYNLGSSEQTLAQSYHVLNMALKTQKPKVLVLGMSMLTADRKTYSDARNHMVLDNMPRSVEWYEALYDLVEENQAEFLFPALAYHSRWNELEERDWTGSQLTDHARGALLNFKVESFSKPELVSEDDTLELKAIPEEYLNKIIALCEENDIQILFTLLPYSDVMDTIQRTCNTVRLMADENDNMTYLNLIDSWEEVGIDGDTDFNDKRHVNMSGAFKVTDYIGRYLTANYDLPDRREDPAYDSWNTDFDLFLEEIKVKIARQKKAIRELFTPMVENRLADFYQGGTAE